MAIQTSLRSEDFRNTIQESRQRFLNVLCNHTPDTESRPNEPARRKSTSRKISFKVRKASSIYRKTIPSNIQKTTITASTVAELASKFNEIIEKQNAPVEEVKLKKLAKRLSSFNTNNNIVTMKQSSTNENSRKEQRKPSIKKKPILNDKFSTVQIIKKKSLIPSSVSESEKQVDEEPEKAHIEDNSLPKPSTEGFKDDKPTSLGFVKAAIENFERKLFQPLLTKRSMSESYKINSTETEEFDTNRRRSCKPDLEIPKELKKGATEELDGDISKISSKSEPNLSATEDVYKRNKIEISVSLQSSKLSDMQIFPSETLLENNMRELKVEYLDVKFRQSDESTEKSEDTVQSQKMAENEFKIMDNEPCYAETDVVNLTLPEVEENKPTLHRDNEEHTEQQEIKPNTSFLWTRGQSNCYQDVPDSIQTFCEGTFVPSYSLRASGQIATSKTLPKDFKGISRDVKEKIYEELEDGYEPFDLNTDYEVVEAKEKPTDESEYEYLENGEENIYETLPSALQNEPLPQRPSSPSSSYCTLKNDEAVSNCYESIYNVETNVTAQTDNNYESIYFRESSAKKDISEKDIAGSIVSSEQKTNSLYGTSLRSWNEGTIYNGSATSDISFSDKSEWIDVSENEDTASSKIIIIKEAVKNKKSTTWSQQCRQQWSKTSKDTSVDEGADSDSDHHYETLQTSDDEGQDLCYDSFASDTESEVSFENLENNGNNGDLPLPAAPNSNDVLTRLAASASKKMRKFTKNLSMTRNDISKSLTRMTRRKSKNDVNDIIEDNGCDNINFEAVVTSPASEANSLTKTEVDENNEKNKSLSRKGFLNKIRRSIIMSSEQASEITSQLKGKSTFYLTPTINVDDPDDSGERKTEDDSGISLSPIDRERNLRNKPTRPQNPPPPAPVLTLTEDLKKALKEKRSTSWYAEVSLCKGPETKTKLKEKRPNTCWYDEIGLYQNSTSTPSTSSAENSGTHTNITIRSIGTPPTTYANQNKDVNEMYNMKHGNDYYNDSVHSSNSNGNNLSLTSLPGEDIQMMLQNEPLYQFYDAAVLDYVCHDGISDQDSDNYEDIENRSNMQLRPSSRPSAMELIVPKRNSLAFTKTLWCEIPEVLQSSVLSTLSTHQKKLQEAKFEMVTSEASYLNSLNVLNDHFIKNLRNTLTDYEFELLFGKIEAVRQTSDKLLLDLERCWQDNILLHGVCDIIRKHAEEDFSVYIPYCENHMLLDQMMKKLRDRPSFAETLKQLESSPVCQSLSLYSFLMLPMQRITRWPLLLDAVLKRLEQHDSEYLTCQYVLATTNKIVNQCNEAARNKDRELEMLSIESKMEFGKGVPPIELTVPNRWLVRSGNVTHMQPKSEEIKLTFGKKVSKATLHLFIFNDLLIVTKPKSDNLFTVMHYCSRNFTELSTSDQLLAIPGKDMTGKYLFFLTLLENQNKKTVEFLLSCSSESDKQRWIEALSPPKSEDPDEVVYECWDCPQVTAIHNYSAEQPDELNLSKADIINVTKKMNDGWYYGERIRDGQTGWFPSNYTVEIANPHVRARNLKQRYRLLTFSENYLKNK